ncbi:PucR family transcriptional regulator ligand-binding domain-containing protein [Streptomyces sp. NPDC002785]|uniref:PucR family transcriptional regulator ligand-binding domain-containing protein n=1 Tax=Streptomyces sp. NPDC002785 TaxID=3154543 RepID=UPI003318C0D6
MGVFLSWLARRHGLGLTVLAGRSALDRKAVCAHNIELADPTPWPSGGELLLTTGLRLPGTPGQRACVARLTGVGVAAVALGTGPSHAQVPAAAETAGADPHVPFGGSRHSGFGPREQGSAARDFFTTTTTVYVRGSRTVTL